MNLSFKYYKYLLVILVFLSIKLVCNSQTKVELEEKKRKTEIEIKNANNLLKKTKKQKKYGYNQLLVINRKIIIQEELIETINQEIIYLSNEILVLQDTINRLNEEMEKMKTEYAELLIQTYKRRNKINELLYIFSAEDFNQAYNRIKYIQQYEKYREKKANDIVKKNEEITNKLELLSLSKAEKRTLLLDNVEINETLLNDKSEKSTLIVGLKQKEKELRKKIEQKKLKAKRIQKEIQKIIEEEIRKAEDLARKKSNENILLTLTPGDQIISDNFEENKSRLPWPTERGIITSEFGLQEHPVLKGIKIKNDGVDISTTEGSYARSVFKGVIAKIVYLPGINKVVLIRHGNFFTVYTNLEDVLVKVNDEVKEKQLIGKIYTDINDENKTYINFQIWKETQKLNPINWIVR